MKVMVFEPNLFWATRLNQTLKALGHEIVKQGGEVALVNLGAAELDPPRLVVDLRQEGIYVIGHAGHKEKELREMGKSAGCDRIASNSEMTFKLKVLLEEVQV